MIETIGPILRHKGGDIWSLPPDASVFEAIQLMADKRVGALLVIDGTRKLVGIVSERDYARKVILLGRSSRDTRVSDIMTSPVLFVTPEQTVNECMRILTDNRIRHLPVMEGERVVGIISIGDLVKSIINGQQETIHQLNNYIVGKYPG